MSASTLARSLPASAFRRWRSLRTRTRVALGSLTIVAAAFAWFFLRGPVDGWPARAVLKIPQDTWSLAFSPDGKTFLTSNGVAITPWDTATGRPRAAWPIKLGRYTLTGAYSPDGKTFAGAIFHYPQSLEIQLIDTATGRPRATLKTEEQGLYNLAFADDGRTVRAFLGDNSHIKQAVTWDSSTGEQTSSRAVSAPMRAGHTAISPDGRLLAYVAFQSGSAQLWDLEADRSLGGLLNPSRIGTVGPVAFSIDGQTLAVGRDDGAIDLWDVPGRKLLKALPGHSGDYASGGLRFSPDGRTLASAGNDSGPKSIAGQIRDGVELRLFGRARGSAPPEVIVVDVATGRRIARASSSLFLMYSPDGRTLATRQDDLSIRLRDLPDKPK